MVPLLFHLLFSGIITAGGQLYTTAFAGLGGLGQMIGNVFYLHMANCTYGCGSYLMHWIGIAFIEAFMALLMFFFFHLANSCVSFSSLRLLRPGISTNTNCSVKQTAPNASQIYMTMNGCMPEQSSKSFVRQKWTDPKMQTCNKKQSFKRLDPAMCIILTHINAPTCNKKKHADGYSARRAVLTNQIIVLTLTLIPWLSAMCNKMRVFSILGGGMVV